MMKHTRLFKNIISLCLDPCLIRWSMGQFGRWPFKGSHLNWECFPQRTIPGVFAVISMGGGNSFSTPFNYVFLVWIFRTNILLLFFKLPLPIPPFSILFLILNVCVSLITFFSGIRISGFLKIIYHKPFMWEALPQTLLHLDFFDKSLRGLYYSKVEHLDRFSELVRVAGALICSAYMNMLMNEGAIYWARHHCIQKKVTYHSTVYILFTKYSFTLNS